MRNIFTLIIGVLLNHIILAQCPSDMIIQGKDLITNGSFDKGFSFFKSEYKFTREFFEVDRLEPGYCSIQINPFYANPDYTACYGWDKVDNSMFIVNGDDKLGKIIWSQELSVQTNTTYTITFYVAAVNEGGASDIDFDVLINDEKIDEIEHRTDKACNWKQYNLHWDSKNNTNATLTFSNQYEYEDGNNFALDDIAMFACQGQSINDLISLLGKSIEVREDKEVLIASVETPKTEIKSITEQIKEHKEKPTVKKAVVLHNIFFDFGKDVLKEESFSELNELASIMVKDGLKIKISGHTDNVGSEESNLVLSKNRANSVKNYLIRKGVLLNNIESFGAGSSKPVSSNDTEEGRKNNRRVEFKIID